MGLDKVRIFAIMALNSSITGPKARTTKGKDMAQVAPKKKWAPAAPRDRRGSLPLINDRERGALDFGMRPYVRKERVKAVETEVSKGRRR